MSNTTRGRLLRVNQLIIDQADFFQLDGYHRVTGLGVIDVQVQLFHDNVPQPWVLTSGSGVTDAKVAAGKVYFSEISGAAGCYSVRFRPNVGGYWRLLISYPTGQQTLAQDYDVTLEPTSVKGTIKASVNGC